MMTTLSIDSMTTIPCASAVDATSIPATPSVAVDLTTLPHSAFAEEQTPFGGLAELVADNAALGEALQSLVDALDKPGDRGEPRVFALPQPSEAMTGAAAPQPSEAMTGAAAPQPSEAMTGAAAPQPSEAMTGAAAPQLSETVRGGFQPPRMTDAFVEKTVVAESKPAMEAVEGPAREGTRSTDVRPDMQPTVVDVTTVSENPGGAAVESKSKSVVDAPESVVLLAAPVIAAPVGDPAAPVCEASEESVSAVSRAAPIDVSSMFFAAAEEVAAAVTVSPALMRGEAGEIRVQLRPDVLEGAEVIVAVDGKKMDVTFVPTVTHVADMVAANQSLVQQQLASKIVGFEISVAVAQTVATNISVGVASSASAQAAVARARRTNGRA